jgi:hypothetical protein
MKLEICSQLRDQLSPYVSSCNQLTIHLEWLDSQLRFGANCQSHRTAELRQLILHARAPVNSLFLRLTRRCRTAKTSAEYTEIAFSLPNLSNECPVHSFRFAQKRYPSYFRPEKEPGASS